MGKRPNKPTWPEKDAVEEALRRATWRAVMLHKALGHPIAAAESDGIRWLHPHEIPEQPEDKDEG